MITQIEKSPEKERPKTIMPKAQNSQSKRKRPTSQKVATQPTTKLSRKA